MNSAPSSAAASQNLGFASLVMMSSVFLSRLIGLARESVIAYVGGIGNEVGAYQVAFILPEILNHIVASGFLSVTFIPIFSRYLVNEQEPEGWRVFSLILTCFGSLLTVFIVLSMVFAPWLVAVCAPGGGMDDPLLFAKAVRMTRIILPAQLLFFIGGLLMAVQFAKRRFLIPALAPLIYNSGIIVGGLLLGRRYGMEAFAWGVLAGAMAGNLAVQLWGAWRCGLIYRPTWDFRHPDFKKYVWLTLPLMLGLTMTFSSEFLFRFFGSFLAAGNIAVLNFGLRVMLILVGLFGQAVGTASYPFLARLMVEKGVSGVNRLLNKTLRYLALVIPFSVLMIVLRFELVRLLFQRGRFDADATAVTADVLICFLVGAFAYSAYTMVVRAYFASQNTLFPALYGTIAVVLSLPIYLLGLNTMGVYGIALAVSISGILQVLWLFHFWNRHSHNPDRRKVYIAYVKLAALSAPIGLALHVIKTAVFPDPARQSAAASVMVAAAVGCLFMALLAGAGYGLKVREIKDPLERVAAILKRKANSA